MCEGPRTRRRDATAAAQVLSRSVAGGTTGIKDIFVVICLIGLFVSSRVIFSGFCLRVCPHNQGYCWFFFPLCMRKIMLKRVKELSQAHAFVFDTRSVRCHGAQTFPTKLWLPWDSREGQVRPLGTFSEVLRGLRSEKDPRNTALNSGSQLSSGRLFLGD